MATSSLKQSGRNPDTVFQLKITLTGSKPPIWRRIQVRAGLTFWELHCAIQDAMGWGDGHLHGFRVANPKYVSAAALLSGTGKGFRADAWERDFLIGPPDRDGDIFGFKKLDEKSVKVATYLAHEGQKCEYTYDYGDNWEHTVLLEKILPREKSVAYPRIIKGKRACPPEDCGGLWGYEEICIVLATPPGSKERRVFRRESGDDVEEWVGEGFDPEQFNLDEVVFVDPKQHSRYY